MVLLSSYANFMNMRLVLLILALCYASLVVSQSKNTIVLSGKVVDIETKQPLEYAAISIHDVRTDSIINGTSTNRQGNFKLSIIRGSYTFKIQFLAFNTLEFKDRLFNDHLNLTQ